MAAALGCGRAKVESQNADAVPLSVPAGASCMLSHRLREPVDQEISTLEVLELRHESNGFSSEVVGSSGVTFRTDSLPAWSRNVGGCLYVFGHSDGKGSDHSPSSNA